MKLIPLLHTAHMLAAKHPSLHTPLHRQFVIAWISIIVQTIGLGLLTVGVLYDHRVLLLSGAGVLGGCIMYILFFLPRSLVYQRARQSWIFTHLLQQITLDEQQVKQVIRQRHHMLMREWWHVPKQSTMHPFIIRGGLTPLLVTIDLLTTNESALEQATQKHFEQKPAHYLGGGIDIYQATRHFEWLICIPLVVLIGASLAGLWWTPLALIGVAMSVMVLLSVLLLVNISCGNLKTLYFAALYAYPARGLIGEWAEQLLNAVAAPPAKVEEPSDLEVDTPPPAPIDPHIYAIVEPHLRVCYKHNYTDEQVIAYFQQQDWPLSIIEQCIAQYHETTR